MSELEQKARQAAEKIMEYLHPDHDEEELQAVVETITDTFASTAIEGGRSACIEKVREMRDVWDTDPPRALINSSCDYRNENCASEGRALDGAWRCDKHLADAQSHTIRLLKVYAATEIILALESLPVDGRVAASVIWTEAIRIAKEHEEDWVRLRLAERVFAAREIVAALEAARVKSLCVFTEGGGEDQEQKNLV